MFPSDILEGLFKMLVVVVGFFTVFELTFHFLTAIGLYRLAKRQHIKNAWLSYIPIIKLYVWGKLVDNQLTCKIRNLRFILPVSSALTHLMWIIPILTIITSNSTDIIKWIEINTIFSLAFNALFYYALYKLLHKYRPRVATLWTLISVVVAHIIYIKLYSIFIFIIRNDEVSENDFSDNFTRYF